jgi:glycosyltransferase involved in cell wall biosynthesis
MKIGIPCFGADSGKSGIGVYLNRLLAGMAPLLNDDRAVLYGSKSDLDFFDPKVHGITSKTAGTGFGNPVMNVGWHQTLLPAYALHDQLDCLFLPAANRRTPIWAPCRTVGTVHDMSSIHVREKYDPARVFYISTVLPWLFGRLDRVITVSESTRKDIVNYAGIDPDRIDVIHLGVDHSAFHPGPAGDLDDRHRPDAGRILPFEEPFLLYVSRLEHPGKNHVQMIRAWELLKAKGYPHKLVFVGKDWFRAEVIHQAAAASKYSSDIIFKGFIKFEELPVLYRQADCVVYPSLYEGFGLPLLEAMACGAPVACSNVSSLPEVAGDGAAMFDPGDHESIAHEVSKIIDDRDYRARLIKRGTARSLGFTWEKTAEATLKILRGAR